MPVEPGQTLLHYRIVDKLGEGGMGQVWRAIDTTLDREVALKALPETLAAEGERLERFEREARLLASLNHPNIATIHGMHVTPEGVRFLAMEIVPGEDLAQRISRGPLPVDVALGFARQIADALAAAHASGVIHRDLKPANIRITPQGQVKVLDFGLAKALAPAGAASGDEGGPSLSHSPTMTSSGTAMGMVLGTAAYMSPEQARGQAVDRRSDIWSFGCVLYEMLTGRQTFNGATVSDMLAAVLRADPDWDALPGATPTSIRRLLRRCLAKDPERRLRDVGDARLELDDAGTAPPESVAPSRPSRLPWALLALVSLVALAALVLAWTRGGSSAASAPLFKFERKTFDQQVIYGARFMPDGQTIVYSSALVGNRPEIFLLQSGAMAPRSIASDGTHLLSVSADGELAILTDTTYLNHRIHEGTLARMKIDGSPRPLVENVRDADWGPDGELAVVRRVSGKDRLEYPLDQVLYETTGYVSEPRVSADGSRVAFLDHPTSAIYDDRGWVKVVDLQGNVATLTREYAAVEGLAWSRADERLLFSGSPTGSEMYQPLSVGPNGGDVSPVTGSPGNLIVVDVAPDGRWLAIEMEGFYGIAVRPSGGGADIDLSWLDQGWGCSVSPDGEAVVFTSGFGNVDYMILTRRLDGSPVTTLGPGNSQGFSPDGRWVAGTLFSSQEIVLYPTGAGTTRRLERGAIESYDSVEWFPDSRNLLIVGNEPSSRLRSYRQSIDGGPPVPVTPEGVFGWLSPRGDRVLARDPESAWLLYPLDGDTPTAASGLLPSDQVTGWSPNGAAVYVHDRADIPLRLTRVDLPTGERGPSFAVGPEREPGLVILRIDEPVLDPNRPLCYMYQRRLSDLFLAAELKR